ncbi:MAG: winged helix-turn-helix transcriptional regulator [Deltaproteobacteria bacterium]|nr:winged helix-turn-helix transcriptional regulator [Deltaproteobacteria bacterium]MBW2420764.1 winged helix-turn-helix transcriptional regulator [Deltaproteobacteria bacterium]
MAPSDPSELGKIDALLRAGDVPEAWKPLLEAAEPATLLIMMWAGRLGRRVEAFYQQTLRPHGLKYSDYALLLLLRLAGPHSPKNLNRHLAITPGGQTKSIDRLEKGGLVRRRPDPEDGRSTRILLTKKGERMVAKIFASDLKAHEAIFTDLDGDARMRIAAALRDLLDAFEGENAGPRR